MATLTGIARREKGRAPMQTIDSVAISEQEGVQGDSRGKPGRRQVTLLSQAQWEEACQDAGAELPWTYRRANLLVAGISFSAEMVGNTVVIGGLRMEITGETDPCPRMDQQHDGLTRALTPDWRGGVCCRVLEGGNVAVGDTVEIVDS